MTGTPWSIEVTHGPAAQTARHCRSRGPAEGNEVPRAASLLPFATPLTKFLNAVDDSADDPREHKRGRTNDHAGSLLGACVVTLMPLSGRTHMPR